MPCAARVAARGVQEPWDRAAEAAEAHVQHRELGLELQAVAGDGHAVLVLWRACARGAYVNVLLPVRSHRRLTHNVTRIHSSKRGRVLNRLISAAASHAVWQTYSQSQLRGLLLPSNCNLGASMQRGDEMGPTCALKMPEVARLAGRVPPSAPLKLMLRYTAAPKALLCGRTSAPLEQECKGSGSSYGAQEAQIPWTQAHSMLFVAPAGQEGGTCLSRFELTSSTVRLLIVASVDGNEPCMCASPLAL